MSKDMNDERQDWFWTKERQQAEAEADAELERGEHTAFASVEELIADLHRG